MIQYNERDRYAVVDENGKLVFYCRLKGYALTFLSKKQKKNYKILDLTKQSDLIELKGGNE